MKSEAETTAKLEEAITQFNAVLDAVPEGSTPTEEQKIQIASTMSFLLALGWVLDCEEEMTPIVRAWKFATLAEKFGQKVGEG